MTKNKYLYVIKGFLFSLLFLGYWGVAVGKTANKMLVAAITNYVTDMTCELSENDLVNLNLQEGKIKWIDATEALKIRTYVAQHNKSILFKGAGGSAGNTLSGMSHLGASVRLFGALANDDLGHFYKTQLKLHKIHYHLTPVQNHNLGSGVCYVFRTIKNKALNFFDKILSIFTDKKDDKCIVERTMATNLGVSGDVRLSKKDVDLAAKAECLLVEGYGFEPETTYQSMEMAAKQARHKGKHVALTLSADFCVEKNFDKMNEFIKSYVTIALANDSEAMLLTQTKTPLEAAKALKSRGLIGAVTCGCNGAYVFDQSGLYHINLMSVKKVVDTTGAGDQFAAGFLYGLLTYKDIIKAGQLGTFLASEVIQHWGGHLHQEYKVPADIEPAWGIEHQTL